MYNFIMIGRRVDNNMYVGQIVWVKGTIQVEEKNEDSIKEILKQKVEKVLELTHPRFHWRDVSLMKQEDNEKIVGIHLEDIEYWGWYFEYDEESGFKEFPYSEEKIKKLNSQLSVL